MNFKDKSIIITGASAGIGEELAVELAKRGAKLTLAARSAEALDRVVRRCIEAGTQAIAVPTDVGNQESCRQMVARAVEKFGGVDVLVNNAGIGMWARFEEVTDLSIYDQLMRINYLGSVYGTAYALPYLKKSRGLIVAVSSLTGKTGVPTRTGYAASKHAMQGFFDSLRIELRETGVDVLIVSPGFVATDIRARALGSDGKAKGESPREESSDTMSVAECVRLMIGAMEKRQRELVMTTRGKLAQWMKLIAPAVVDRIAQQAVQEKQ